MFTIEILITSMEKSITLNDKGLGHLIEALSDSLDSKDRKELEYRQRLLRFATEEKEQRE